MNTYLGKITSKSGHLWEVQLSEVAPLHLRTLFITNPPFPVAIGQRVRVNYVVSPSSSLWQITEVIAS